MVTCRAIGILKMEDEAGMDGKVLAVPINKILSLYSRWQKPEDLQPLRLKTIAHFFEHYKDLEEGKGQGAGLGGPRSRPPGNHGRYRQLPEVAGLNFPA